MQDICCKLSRTAAVVVILLVACVGSAWAGYFAGIPWQVGDLIVCSGGTCNVVRPSTGKLLDQFSDTLLGFNGGLAMNNSLHLVFTDNGGGADSNVLEYTIASQNPLTATPVAHTTVVPPFNASGGTNKGNSQAMATRRDGHIFVYNSGSGSPPTGTPVPNIVELNQDGSFANYFQLPVGCFDTAGQKAGMDFNPGGTLLYLTSEGGSIQQFTPGSGCSTPPFAQFGSGVKLYGIQDIPANGIAGTSCPPSGCPADETVLVLATGFIESDATLGGEGEVTEPDSDDTNICGTSTYCALLLHTTGAALTGPPASAGLASPMWAPHALYTSIDQILDPGLYVQKVATPGRSRDTEPTFNDAANGNTNDNAVIWQDKGQQPWQGFIAGKLSYTAGEIVVDGAAHVQQVTQAGAPGPGPTGPTFNDAGQPSVDGLQWMQVGASSTLQFAAWQSGTQYCGSCTAGLFIQNCQPDEFNNCTATGTIWQATVPAGSTASPGGISGSKNPVVNTDNTENASAVDNAVQWTDEGARTDDTPYTNANNVITSCGSSKTCIGDSHQHLWLATTTGRSGTVDPNLVTNEGTPVTDGLTWANQGTSVIARYPLPGVPQSLSLEPLVADCTGTNCSSTVANPTVSNFFAGDSGSATVYKTNFANTTGSPAPTQISANFNCASLTGCTPLSKVDGLRVYGAQSSAQPDLTKLASTTLTNSSPSATVYFPLPGTFPSDPNTNKLTAQLFLATGSTITTIPNTPITIYALSLLKTTGTSDPQPQAIPPSPGIPCEPTTSDPTTCLLWKLDIDVPSGTNLNAKFQAPTGIDANTHVFIDESFDTTRSADNTDPTSLKTSVHMLHEIPNSTFANGGGCAFTSPVPGHCFQSPTTVKFQFQCTTLPSNLVSTLKPRLVINQTNSSGNFLAPVYPLIGTNKTSNYTFDPIKNQWGFTWMVPPPTGTVYYKAWTFDGTDQITGFFEFPVIVASKCPK